MVQLQKAFCCLSLRTGNLILGWFHLIAGTLVIITLALMFVEVDRSDPKDLPPDVTKYDLKVDLVILLVLCCLSPLMAVCHLYGSYKYRKGYLLPYLIGGGIQLAVLIVSIIYLIVKNRRVYAIVSQIISLLISFYLYLIPWSFYKELKENRASAMQQA